MIFRRRPPPDSNETRLRALGRLLDRRGYSSTGLCIFTVEDGFAVSGLRVPAAGEAYGLVDDDETVDGAELTAAIARLRDGA